MGFRPCACDQHLIVIGEGLLCCNSAQGALQLFNTLITGHNSTSETKVAQKRTQKLTASGGH